jgi:dipeptidyl aminopeptidase/acylaminoacyl peptidase
VGPRGGLARLVLVLFAASGCGDSPTDPGRDVVAGVDLDALFAAPGPAEGAAIEADWAQRSPGAAGVVVERADAIPLGSSSLGVRVVSHEVDGRRHYGAILASAEAPPASVPILVYAHGGDAGVSVEEVVLVAATLALASDDFVILVPSFRSEPLRWAGEVWISEGEASPWDRDVDDALALLDVALLTTPAADPERIGVLGLSRGGAVGLLMGIRDPRIAAVVSFFAPTDFLGPFVREVVRETLLGRPPELPGVRVLSERFIGPLKAGALTVEEVRLELLRRSAARFAARLPAVQLHHGTADEVVPVEEAGHLEAAMAAEGRGPPEFEAHIYPGATHNPLTMPLSLSRTREFLRRFLEGGA